MVMVTTINMAMVMEWKKSICLLYTSYLPPVPVFTNVFPTQVFDVHNAVSYTHLNILFKKMGMPTLIILGVFENITHTGTEFVGQSDSAEKGGDDWIRCV